MGKIKDVIDQRVHSQCISEGERAVLDEKAFPPIRRAAELLLTLLRRAAGGAPTQGVRKDPDRLRTVP